ncbi:protein phosphatase 2C domain-containing protein [Ornithinimicrobium sp. F0845]|uniref:PP2C family protein-serine/threonine phosphatase n=1 Tax=Ornithinimicrobium sp. F0845 TaxID=2926412 RepID=UPI001FF605F7|nr:protein phosphatase 2C domain-containing protein [Ornithinimicrobium sp. F0845]MCK0113433.1 protein phosphatase 2C domain-containing protein [Ornithinimicrobium sp. F0845]
MVALRYAARSHLGLGTKSRNEDSAYAGPELLVLCDGMGGHAAGDVASSLVVGELVHLDGESHGADDMSVVLEQAMMDANDRLAEVAEESENTHGMGTTCIAMMRSGTKLAVANIGDSRAYLRRGTRVTQITKDHSFVQQLLDEGRIGEEEALHHPQRSLVTRVFTGRPDDRPDLSMRELRAGDRLLLCSDGLTDYVAESTVAELLRSEDPPGKVADQLISIALRASTRDNVTVIVADVVDAGEGTGTTEPQVVGAASERRGTQLLTPQTPAEKAAALSRTVHGTDPAPELAEESARGGLATWMRRSLIGLAILAVVTVGAWATYDWSQRQYFVGEANGHVTIFRGVSQDLGPFVLSSPEEETDVELETLPAHYRNRVINTLTADDRADADRIVEELRFLALPRCEDVIQLPLPGDGTATTAGPDTATATAGPDGVTATAGPDGALSTAGPDDASATSRGPEAATETSSVDDAAATTAPTPPLRQPTVDCVP